MNHLIEIDNEALDYLLAERAFDQLSREEQALVLAQMPEEEYKRLSVLAMHTKSHFSKNSRLFPRSDIRMHAREHLKRQKILAKKAKRKAIRSMLIQIAAAVALLVLGIQLTTYAPNGIMPGHQGEGIYTDSTSTDSASQHQADPAEDTVFSRLKIGSM